MFSEIEMKKNHIHETRRHTNGIIHPFIQQIFIDNYYGQNAV